ncbi:Lytic transglycosylase catalytic [Solidesulfovibrio fructosivorans JJ]]|uniref:Lytic transglycosylase catalytic n=1 Tax=Solidesulfovibrio fructosivorans JJ] TaxID=596151 RepID=E1JSW2_SOLFR|nr:lytic transglycosylase domain-containing protein [Solidesulfovibrio fructosivorans]EFL52595.1 Lytic transglycosylase catalytic [Solidesulfovibrio fructosivorans JJ]]
MRMPGIKCFSDRFGWVWIALVLTLVAALSDTVGAAGREPWSPPAAPDGIPLPRSARLGGSLDKAPRPVNGENAAAGYATALGINEVLAGREAAGAARLAAVVSKAGPLADVAAYYAGLGFYLAGDAAGALNALTPLTAAPETSFLGRDGQYLALQSAARLGDHEKTLALAESWLTEAAAPLAPEVWLRAAVAAAALGQDRKAADFLRHLSLTWPASKAAAAGNALARALCAKGKDAACAFDPDTPANVLLRAEAMVEKRSPEAALTLLQGSHGFDAGQAARADYVRGKALYRQRKFRAATGMFAKAAAIDPDAPLAGWARYHEARCLWRSFDAEDIARMEALLRRVLAAPSRDDPLREVAARHLALVLAENGHFKEALDAAQQLKGLAVSPDLAAQGASLTAILRYVTGDMAGAVTDLEAFTARFPDDDWADGARFWRGKALAALDRPEEAAAAYLEAMSRRPNTYYGGKAAAALAGLGKAVPDVVASSVRRTPTCPGHADGFSQQAADDLDKARLLADSGLPSLAGMELDFASRAMPERADLAMANIAAAEEMGRRGTVLRTAWRTFGGCLLRGTAADLAPLRQALYPRAYDRLVVAALKGSDIDPDMVYSLIRQESFFDPKVVSGAGAVGLMQLMPATAKSVGKKLDLKVTRRQLFDPAVNIRLGVAFFRERVEKAGGLAAALAGYNAGQTRARLWTRHLGGLGQELFTELIPYTETRDYVRRITANAMMYRRLYGD